MLINVADENEPENHFVRVDETHVGKGVFATRPYPESAIVGEITGDLVKEPTGSTEYSFDFEHGWQLEPYEPFRYLNHSCDPNCEFDILDEPGPNGKNRRALFVYAIRPILPDEELTIAYNWPASCAIECHCQSENCVGWIVCETEIDQIADREEDPFESEYEFHNVGYFFPE